VLHRCAWPLHVWATLATPDTPAPPGVAPSSGTAHGWPLGLALWLPSHASPLCLRPQALRAAGDVARQFGHRLTFHPSEFVKIGGERREVVDQSKRELEVHSRIFDEMGFLPATPYNKINM
jgi:hypothetical protein